MWDFAIPTHATIPTAKIIHPNMSYLRSLLFFFFLELWKITNDLIASPTMISAPIKNLTKKLDYSKTTSATTGWYNGKYCNSNIHVRNLENHTIVYLRLLPNVQKYKCAPPLSIDLSYIHTHMYKYSFTSIIFPDRNKLKCVCACIQTFT